MGLGPPPPFRTLFIIAYIGMLLFLLGSSLIRSLKYILLDNYVYRTLIFIETDNYAL